MKKTVLFLPLYLGTFIIAFTVFFYIKQNSENNTSNEFSQLANDQVVIASKEKNLSVWHNTHAENTTSLSQEPLDSDEQMIDRKKISKSINVKPAGKSSPERNAVYHPQSANAPGMSHTAEYYYTETETTSHNTSTTVMNIAGYNDYSSNSTVKYNTSSTDTIDVYDTPSVTVENLYDTRADSAAEMTSDGSEFLPDGSSQEDLANSLSKNPRVYTIKDYQQASISCNNSYGAPSAHGELMLKLKGC